MHSKKLIIAAAILSVSLFTSSAASAHVVVSPNEAVTAKYQTFTVSVPNEKEISTTKVQLIVPNEITTITPTVKSGWTITTEKDQSGKLKSITWEGGDIPAEQRDEFTFSAKTPDAAGNVHWKAYQTYADNTVVAWDAEVSNHSHSDKTVAGPYSTTKIVTKTPSEQIEQSIQQAQSDTQTSFIISIASIMIALGAVFAATRKK